VTATTQDEGGGLTGPWRAPTNIAAGAAGSIHDDDTAQALGLRGGTVAGSIHMEQYPPLLLRLFGPDWRRRGGLSLWFANATLHGEPVRCRATAAVNGRAEVWMETEAGVRVNEGTASAGVDPDSALRRRLAAAQPAGELRMLAGVRVGATGDAVVRIPSADIDRHLPVLTEPLPDYAGPGPRTVPYNRLIDAFRAVEPDMVRVNGPFVGLYGAAEIQHLAGPVVAERDYRVTGRVLALVESPRTEGLWYEAEMTDARTGAPVARFLHLTRLMKASSPLWVSRAV
jgi:hypothetical protein